MKPSEEILQLAQQRYGKRPGAEKLVLCILSWLDDKFPNRGAEDSAPTGQPEEVRELSHQT